MTQSPHFSVLKQEVVNLLSVGMQGRIRIIDGTLGFAGHSEALLHAFPDAELLGIDRDDTALAFSEKRLEFAKDRIHLKKGSYSQMREFVEELGWDKVDIIFLDIGVSSLQIDEAERGFSYRVNGPLDMRMDLSAELTASGILNTYSQSELTTIFREYGEVKEARQLAAQVVDLRVKTPWETTLQFAALCDKVVYKPRHVTMPSPTLPFQALRIAVNDELGELDCILPVAIELLRSKGRLGVISFHSLEDRRVKHYFQHAAESCHCPVGLPVCCCHYTPNIKIVTKKPVIASSPELTMNSRSSCAKFRVAEKI